MENIGYIVDVLDNSVKVRVDRESACGGNCVSCKGCPQGSVIVECKINGQGKIGDRVKLCMENSKYFKYLFLGYGQTAILMVVGAILGYFIFKAELASVVGALLGLCLGLCIAKCIMRLLPNQIVAEVI